MTDGTSKDHSLVPRWVWLFLAGPVIWYLYFWVVGLAAVAGCVANTGALVTWIAIGMTGATFVAIAHYTWQATRDSGNLGGNRALIRTGYLMGGFIVVATLIVGVPALVLHPC